MLAAALALASALSYCRRWSVGNVGKAQVATARPGGLVAVSSAIAPTTARATSTSSTPGRLLPNNYRYGGSVLAVKGAGGGAWRRSRARASPAAPTRRSCARAASRAGHADDTIERKVRVVAGTAKKSQGKGGAAGKT